jgi:hypothetical protein
MDDFNNIAMDMTKNIKKLQKLNEKSLQDIIHHDPEKVSQLLKDNKDLTKALKNKDLNAILNIQQKYADKNNK